MYGKVLVYFFIFELQTAATHTLRTVVQGRGGAEEMLVFLYLTMCTTSTKKKTKCMLLREGEKKNKKGS